MDKFLKEYLNSESSILKEILPDSFQQVITIFKKAYENDNQIFVIGNGGSAATANHFAGDLGKNAIQEEGKRRFRILSLAESASKITMYGNDVAFTEVFTQQMMNVLREGDVVISISASGSSPDLISAAKYTKNNNATFISFAGFNGGKLLEFADADITVSSKCYEIIEDIHMIITHLIVSYFKGHPEELKS